MRNKRLAFFLAYCLLAAAPSFVRADMWEGISWFSTRTCDLIYYKNFLLRLDVLSNRVYRSINAVSFTPFDGGQLPLSANEWNGYFRIHKGALYVFVNNNVAYSSVHAIYRTTDGEHYSVIRQDQSQRVFEMYENAVSYKDHLYIVLNTGDVLRTTGDGTTPTWQAIAPVPNWGAGDMTQYVSLVEFKEDLYLAVMQDVSIPNAGVNVSRRIFKKTPDDQWALVKSFNQVQDAYYLTSLGGWFPAPKQIKLVATPTKLYFFNTGILWIMDGSAPPQWTKVILPGQIASTPFVLNDAVYLMGTGLHLQKLTPENTWDPASLEIQRFDSPVTVNQLRESGAAVMGSFAYIYNRGTWRLKFGVYNVTEQAVQMVDPNPGQKNIPVLGLKTRVNVNDRLKLTVKNMGTALAGADIERVRLVRSNLQVLGDFAVDPVDKRSWSFPGFVPVVDQNQLFITVDMSENAREGRTLHFQVEASGMEFETNKDFVLSGPLSATESQTIRTTVSAGPPVISGTLVYPQPGKGRITFAYDLSVPSDVSVRIFDRSGVLVSEVKEPGQAAGLGMTSVWDASSFGAGVYYAVVDMNGVDGSKRTIKKKVYVKE